MIIGFNLNKMENSKDGGGGSNDGGGGGFIKSRLHVNKNRAGFTLIELLVVIAIIGILSSIVLASLNTARAKGADAAIKGDLSGIRSQAGIYYDTNLNYGADVADGNCATVGSLFLDSNITQALAHASQVSGGAAECYADDGDVVVGTTADSWAISVPLKTNTSLSWCIDSTGTATSTANGAGISADTATCL